MSKLFFPLRLESIRDLAIAVQELAQRLNTVSIAQDKLAAAPPAEGTGTTAEIADVSSVLHGLAPQSPGDPAKFLNGDYAPAYELVKDSDLSLSDTTTNDVSITEHGFVPKAPNNALKYLTGDAAWTSIPANVTALGALVGAADVVPYFTGVGAMALASLTPYAQTIIACANAAAARTALGLGTLSTLSTVTEGEITLVDVTTINVSTTKHGLAPKLPNDATKYLDGTGAYSVPGASSVFPPALPTFPSISNLELRLSAEVSTIAKDPDGRVTQINDFSGSWGSNFTAAGNSRPRLIPRGMNRLRPGLAFDGVTAKLTAGGTKTVAQPCTVVAVLMNWKGGAVQNNILRDSGSGPVFYHDSGTGWAIFAGTAVIDTNLFSQNTAMMVDGDIGAPAVAMAIFNGAASTIYNNGVASSAGAAGSSGFSGTLYVGGNSTTSFAHMMLYELLIFSKALNSTERGQLNTYYATALDIYL